MRLGRLFGVPVRLNLLSLPMIALALWLGEGRRLSIMAASILFHELMHIAAARFLHVRVHELELTPAGGAARLENLWRLRPGQVAAVALAGPAANLLIMVLAAALCWWGLMNPLVAAALIEQNLIILLFNLLPALPMDGGRVLCGLLSRRMSPAAAARMGTRISGLLSLTLSVLSVYGIVRGRLNITLPMAAAFLLVSAGRERRQAEFSLIESLMGRGAELEEEGALPLKWLAVSGNTTVREAAVRLRPRHMHLIAVYDGAMKLTKVLGEEALTAALLADGEQKIAEISGSVKKNVF